MKSPFLFLCLLILGVAGSGCTIRAQRVSLAFTELPNVKLCGDALQQTIGIAPILDERPAVERTGQNPRALFFLLWNQRTGNYITGDKDFHENIETVMPEAIRHALERSNCFIEAKILPTKVRVQPSAEELLVVFAQQKVRYVLLARLEHFYGEQRQNANFFILPLYFVDVFSMRNQVDSATGHADLVLILYDTQTGQEVLREKVQAEKFSPPEGTYPKAAQEALHEAGQKIANHLYRFVQIQQGSPVFNAENV